MNIFYLDPDPVECAKMHCDTHVVKMILETAQLLSTACRICGYNSQGLYSKTHDFHPCSLWVRENGANYLWLYRLGINLCSEYTYRYGRAHKSATVIRRCGLAPDRLPMQTTGMTQPPQVMPPQYMTGDTVEAYRAYYRGEKASLLKYTRRNPPDWLQDLAVFKEAA